MTDTIAIVISGFALVVSALTAWLTAWRRGNVYMTQPALVYLGSDGDISTPKVYLRTMLYSSGERGHILESMFVKVLRGESAQTFNVWVLGESELSRGSGLYISESGVSCNHHFLLPADGTRFDLIPGEYAIQVFGAIVSGRRILKLKEFRVTLTSQDIEVIQRDRGGIFFDWSPEHHRYHSHVGPKLPPAQHRPEVPGPSPAA
ncbi:MAG TPA: hypothetical protein VGR37_01175 [Longimicrobiaceae bacterium]|nr:hypothetical protein [Longimicrobiaceae bacterium]